MKPIWTASLFGLTCLLCASASFKETQLRHSSDLDMADVQALFDMLGLEAHSFSLQVDDGPFRLNVMIEEYVDGESVRTHDLWGGLGEGAMKALGRDLEVSNEASLLKLFAFDQEGPRVTLRVQRGRLTHNLVSEVDEDDGSSATSFKLHVADWTTEGDASQLRPGAPIPIAAYTLPYWDKGVEAYRYCFFDPDMATWGKRFGVPAYFVVSVELIEP